MLPSINWDDPEAPARNFSLRFGAHADPNDTMSALVNPAGEDWGQYEQLLHAKNATIDNKSPSVIALKGLASDPTWWQNYGPHGWAMGSQSGAYKSDV